MKTVYRFLMLVMLVALASPTVAQDVVSTIAFTSTRNNPTAGATRAIGSGRGRGVLDGLSGERTVLGAAAVGSGPSRLLSQRYRPMGRGKLSSTAIGAARPANNSTFQTFS